MLYHGTTAGGLSVILANSKSHKTGKPTAYFTADRCYALVCCRTPENNFVTMGLRPDGKQHYFERFPNQLKTLYSGKQGFLYTPESMDGLTNTTGKTWESPNDVPVRRCEVIEDVYTALLQEEEAGHLVVHRYAEIDPAEQKMHANYIRDHIGDEGEAMRAFYTKYFSSLWD